MTESHVLFFASRGEMAPSVGTRAELALALEYVKEAEGRALEFDHCERAAKFGEARALLEKAIAANPHPRR